MAGMARSINNGRYGQTLINNGRYGQTLINNGRKANTGHIQPAMVQVAVRPITGLYEAV